MRKILSYLVLLMLFATNSHAVQLTTSMFNGTCAYNLSTNLVNGDAVYGDGGVYTNNYADLSAYSHLIVTLASENIGRYFFNTEGYDANKVTLEVNNKNFFSYGTKEDGGKKLIIDLAKVKAATNRNHVYLNAIKTYYNNDPLNVVRLEVVKAYPRTWDFSEWVSKPNSDDTKVYNKLIEAGGGWTYSDNLFTKGWNATYMTQNNKLTAEFVGSTHSSGNITDPYYFPETADLTFYNDNWDRLKISTNGLGLSFYAGSIGIPNLKSGQVVVFYSDGNAPITANFGGTTVTETGSYIEFVVPDNYSAAETLFEFGNLRNNSVSTNFITKIEILPNNETKYHYDNAKVNNFDLKENGDNQWKEPKGKATVEYSTANNQNLNLRIKLDKGTLASCGITTNDDFYSYFRVYSSDNNVLDASAATLTIGSASDGERISVNNVKALNCGTATLTVEFLGSDIQQPFKLNNYLTINGQVGPRIVWVTGFNSWEQVPRDWLANPPAEGETEEFNGIVLGQPRNPTLGGFYREYYRALGQKEIDGEMQTVSTKADNIFSKYSLTFNVNAYALKAGQEIPSWWHPMLYGKETNEDHYYFVTDDPTETVPEGYTAQTWKTYKTNWRPSSNPEWFYNDDPTNSALQYSLSNTDIAHFKEINTAGGNDLGGGSKYASVKFDALSSDSLEVIASIAVGPGVNPARSVSKISIIGGYLQMRFDPQSVVVNEGNWIQPYLRCPDTKLEDFEKIYVTVDDGTVVTVVDMDKLYEYTGGSSIRNLTDDQINELCGEFIEWKWTEEYQKNEQGEYVLDGNGKKVVIDRYPTLVGIRPKVYGVTAGQETDVKVHIVSPKYSDTGATCHVKVIEQGGDLFHFEMNDVDGHDVASIDDIGDIYMFEGDYIYMPGIIGNPNGNNDYSKAGSYKYLYAIKGDENGTRKIELNRDPYFYGEGVANYFIADTDNGVPLIPTNFTEASQCNQKILIFKEIGLGNYYRNDSLLLFGHKAGAQYLYAEDAQTGWKCKPLRIHVIPREGEGQWYGKMSLMAQKHEMMKNMSYPFTWDFEHMDMTKIYQDASWAQSGQNIDGEKVVGGNGGSYWRKRWDNTERGSKNNPPQYKKYYQWNGVFNADHDDKDGNGTIAGVTVIDGTTIEAQKGLRQRWFKDITANGEYLSLFKGLMINIAGLDYWQQKYTRFNVAEDGTKIMFEGGVHYMSLPGFGATGNVGDTYTTVDETRPAGTVRMRHLHNQMNTNDNVTFESDFVTNLIGTTYTATLDPSKRNDKVKFVIKAAGGSNPVDAEKAGGVIYVGGKSMISTVVNDNGVRFSAHTDSDPYTGALVGGTRIPLFTEPKTYVVELDPWDPEYQEQIYLAMDGTVEIYWMGITTEPRNMRSDHNVFTYSYPKDIDMQKTNEVTKLLTNDIVNDEGKHGVELKTYYGDAFGGDKMTVKPIANTQANYKFGAYEGVFVYPSEDLNKLRDEDKFTQSKLNINGVKGNVLYHWETGEQLPVNSGVKDVPVSTTAVTLDLEQKKDKDGNLVYDDGKPVYVAKTDPKGHYAYKQTPLEYTYSYLPIYFVANAENQDNYNANIVCKDGIARGREHTMDAIKVTADGYDHWVDMPAAPGKYTVDGVGLWYNQRKNKLNGNPFSRWQPQDYVSKTDSIDVAKYFGNLTPNGTYTGPDTEGEYNGKEEWGEKEIDGVMVPRWITLNMTNKFMIRYLKIEEDKDENLVVTKVLDEFLKDVDGNVISAQANTQTPNTGDPEYYYNLVGPSCVRFYRTFVPNYPKGRRASLSLTWDQYNTTTFGKDGMFWNIDGSNRYANFPWVDYEKAKPLGQPTANLDGPNWSNGAKQGLQMVFLLAGDGESMVSEDGGFPDSINGVTESIDSTGEGEFYNLNGVRVTTPRKGVYIYNGRKVVIK